MQNQTAESYTLITGRFETGTPEQKDMITRILGAECITDKYALYFYWYNVIHELGHAILHFNPHPRMPDVEEEPIVNDFAAAYWSHYGETATFDAFKKIISDTLPRFTRPAPEGMDYLTYARLNWGAEAFFSFNNYGWFQFNCVNHSLRHPQPLQQVLQTMSDCPLTPQPQQTLVYDMQDAEAPLKIVQDAAHIVRAWGVHLPLLPHLIVDDPYRHGVSTVGY